MRFVALAFSAVAITATAQEYTDYRANAAAGMVALQRWYHEETGQWDKAQWWQQGCLLSTVAELAAADFNFVPNATRVFDNTFQRVAGTPGDAEPNWQRFVNEAYDDAGWWALAWIAGYDLTGRREYLALAEAIFDNDLVQQGSPSRCGNGGIMWKKNDPYVNAIANELYLSIAAHLAWRTADSDKRAGYLTRAKDQWTWFKASGMINREGLVNDGLNQACKNDGSSTIYTYNQGVILGALMELDRADARTDDSYLIVANIIATAAVMKLTDPATTVLHETCEVSGKNCDIDGQQFKGIFMRNLLRLHHVTPTAMYATFIRANADSVQQHARLDEGTFTQNWAGPPGDPRTASTTSSALDAIIAAVAIGI